MFARKVIAEGENDAPYHGHVAEDSDYDDDGNQAEINEPVFPERFARAGKGAHKLFAAALSDVERTADRRNQRGGFGRFFGCGAAPLLQKVQLFIKNAELNACAANINTGKKHG